jgi:hypothetical protein
MRLKLKFSSARASIKILYLVIRFPLCSGHDAHGDPFIHLYVADKRGLKILGGHLPFRYFLANIKNIHLDVEKKKSSWVEHLGEI